MDWKLTWEGHEWTFADLTGAHIATLALVHGSDSFDNLDPRTGTTRLMAMLSVFLFFAALPDGDLREIQASIADLPASVLIGALSIFDPVAA